MNGLALHHAPVYFRRHRNDRDVRFTVTEFGVSCPIAIDNDLSILCTSNSY